MVAPPVFFEASTLDAWLAEDVGFFDLTSTLLEIGTQPARIAWVARQPMTLACTEEVARMASLQGGVVTHCLPSGQRVTPGTEIVAAQGTAQALLDCWKVGQNLLEYACGIATRTRAMVDIVALANPDVGILTTRKHPPGLRRVAQKAVLAGGAFPHRLGLSETVLIFPQHRALMPGGWKDVRQTLARHRKHLVEKKIVIEAGSYEEAREAARCGADAVQFDKVGAAQLAQWCPRLRTEWPHLRLLAAGGIHLDNAAAYADTGVDALVTSSLYFGPPADIGVNIQRE
ncbi:MAG: ModD protein [Castellaniella sp.]|uniref:ModD protein n=1 Tax=Castellaniella sp. TaxID=1955812 RepID=UPI002A367BA1|nr:ModD protein [Castellaniella sp.]MDY0309730.1 ModD protein [Castellaniella sp.]